ncbi:hypothetical protein [Clostridium sp. ZBS18]|uniref:hypothetical protein n=1 Tax=Clostridium sp. ZBS18 TaxID=2949967 RepID=UPI00207A5ADC|nr:hypothetical protein [Clostridium sp. ZBS18]
MNKELKDNLVQPITYKGKKYYSIMEVLKAYYSDREDITLAEYKNTDVSLNLIDCGFHTDVSMYESIYNQIKSIDEYKDGDN